MLIVPLQATPAQTVSVSLAGQDCRIDVYQKRYGLFCNLYLNDVLLLAGVVCLNCNRIVRDLYFGFVGDLIIMDTQGNDDPDYTGLGSRYQMAYLETTDLPAGQG